MIKINSLNINVGFTYFKNEYASAQKSHTHYAIMASLITYPEWRIFMNKLNRLAVFVLAIAMSALVACASSSKQSGTGEYIDDSVITTKVKAAVLNEPTLKSAEINVETFKGVVQLSGFVNSQSDINKAIEITRQVKGVASVKNDMRLKATP
jgi:hypothetical protein